MSSSLNCPVFPIGRNIVLLILTSMASTSTKIGHGLAKVLGIKLQYRNETSVEPDKDRISRGESVFSISSADTYVEEEPTAAQWIAEVAPGPRQLVSYARSLFPFTSWITRYNSQWLLGDLVAGKHSPRVSPLDPLTLTVWPQELPSAPSLFPRAWHTPSWPSFPLNSVFTLPSWALSSTGYLPPPKTSPLAYV